MRIISGEWKGRRLPGGVPFGVRPTVDAARETLFNILYNHINLDELRVWDICAGTGALGLEALSRGAAHCTFVETSRKVAKVIQENIDALTVPEESYTIAVSDALDFLCQQPQGTDLIFCDPPYNKKLINKVLELIVKNKLLAAGGIIITERSSFETILTFEGLEQFNSKKFGETVVDFFRNSG